MMEEVRTSETSVSLYETTRPSIQAVIFILPLSALCPLQTLSPVLRSQSENLHFLGGSVLTRK
jgi:hypothetical protein